MTGKNDRPRQYEYLKDMSIEKLEEILKASDDFLSESEEAFIDAVAEEIVQRERENRTGRIPDVNEAKREFKETYFSPEREGLFLFPDEDEDNKADKSAAKSEKTRHRRPFPLRGLAAAAVIVLLITTALPSALGYESFAAMVGYWNETVFHFDFINRDPKAPSDTAEENFETLQDALDANGVALPLVPEIPARFEAIDIYTTIFPEYGRTDYNAFYKAEGQNLSIYLVQREEPVKTRSYEKDGTLVKNLVVNNIEHYIYENNGRITITWYMDVFECSIQADISREEADELVYSIYEE